MTGVRVAHWELAAGAAALLFAVWLGHPVLGLAVAAGVVSVAAVVLAARTRPPAAIMLAAVTVAAGGTAIRTARQVAQVETSWDVDSTGVRWRLVASAGARLDADLAQAVGLARSLAETGVAATDGDRDRAFARLANATRGDGPERGVVVFDAEGRPWAWGGRHRQSPPMVAGLDARITPFYAVLSAGRQGPDGAFTVAHVLLAADSAVPDRAAALDARFERASGVGLEFYPPGRGPYWADVFDYCVPACGAAAAAPDTLFSVRLVPPSQGAYKLALLGRGSAWVAGGAVVLLLTLLALGGALARAGGAAGLAALLVFTSAGRHLPLGRLFSSATYYVEGLGPASASAGGLLASGALVFLAAAALWRSARPWRAGVVGAVAIVAAMPVLTAWLARGITPPSDGTDAWLWLHWQVTLTVVSAALLLAAAAIARRTVVREVPAWLPLVGAAWAVAAAIGGTLAWVPGGGLASWHWFEWLPAFALAALPVSAGRMMPRIALVAGAWAATLTWTASADGRIALAERDAANLRQSSDPVAVGLLERFGASLQEEVAPRTAGELYGRWSRSALEADRYPAVLAAWSPEGVLQARLDLAQLPLPDSTLRRFALAASGQHVPGVAELSAVPGREYVLTVPFPDGSAVTVGLGSRSRLTPPVRVARFLRGERTLPAPYGLGLSELVAERDTVASDRVLWERQGWVARGDMRMALPDGARHLHATVLLGSLPAVLVRGALVVVLDALLVGVLWLLSEGIAGRLRVPPILGELVGARSYRARLGLAFAVFFVVPTVGFAAWSASRLPGEAQRTRDLVIRQTLADAAGSVREFTAIPRVLAHELLRDVADRLNADFLFYEEGQLWQASVPVLADLGVLDWYLAPPVEHALTEGDEIDMTVDQQIAGRPTRVGYRLIGGSPAEAAVLAAPRLLDDPELVRSEQDLVFGLLLITLGGLAGAAGLAGIAARALAKPVHALQSAAEVVRRGELPPPFERHAPGEFKPVMEAFDRMARDVHASREALEAQRQRTAAVLRNVGTGVVALDDGLAVVTSNPRAEEILGGPLAVGMRVEEGTGGAWQPVWAWVRRVAGGHDAEEPREFALGTRQIRVQVAPLTGAASGWVVALDDVTDLARAVRVLAWGELARQIAHEIKNPLTPIRLGVQHLRRAYDAPRGDYDEVLDHTSRQILAEIERLDAIARAFSRFGAPPAGAEPLGRVDAVEVARDTAALYALAGGAGVRVETDGPVAVRARGDELKEVLINLVENARAADATHVVLGVRQEGGDVVLTVRDDGRGIAVEDLPRIFEPQFSTTTSGTGLGLAICRRLVESWGGKIGAESAPGAGTTVRLVLIAAA